MDQTTTTNSKTTAPASAAVGRIRGTYAFAPNAADLIPEGRRPKSISLGELLNKRLPKREHLVLPWLRQAESAMVYAAPGVGKSLFALSLALAVAGGGTVLGKWTAPKARRVLFVDGEMPLDDIQSRAEMLLRAAGQGLDLEAVQRNLFFEARQYQHAGTIFTDLSDGRSRETLIDKIKRGGVELVILDNLSTLATVDDENAAGDFNDTIKFLLRLKQEGVACLLVHHSNKTGESYRGSSKIATTFEVIMRLGEVSRKATDSPNTTRFRLTWDKFRGERDEGTGVPLDVALQTAAFDGEGTQAGQLQWICTLAEDTRIEQLLELVKSGEYRNMRELQAALGVSLDTIHRLKNRAVTAGHITEAEWLKHLPGRKGGRRTEEAAESLAGEGESDF